MRLKPEQHEKDIKFSIEFLVLFIYRVFKINWH